MCEKPVDPKPLRLQCSKEPKIALCARGLALFGFIFKSAAEAPVYELELPLSLGCHQNTEHS